MRKILLLPLVLVLFVTCQKEDNIQQTPIQANNLHPKTFKTPEDVFTFLGREMPEIYTPEEIGRVKAMLEVSEISDHARSGNTVELPAGSVDALEAAAVEAGAGGTVIIKAGEHTENGLVTIGHRINIIGEKDAIILLGNPMQLDEYPIKMVGGIQIQNAARSVFKGVHLTGGEVGACIGLFVENSDRTLISNNLFTNIQFSINVQKSDFVNIRKNEVIGDLAVLQSTTGNLGITITNGKSVTILDNKVSANLFGIWNCDRGGVNWGNTTTNCFYGQIICKVTPSFAKSDGEIIEAEASGNHWLLALNESSDNFYGGIVVIDGAHHNTLLANNGSGNSAYDVDLVGLTERFGFLAPTSSNNRVYSYSGQTIKDCGEDNRVVGGTMVDTSEDPCDNVAQ